MKNICQYIVLLFTLSVCLSCNESIIQITAHSEKEAHIFPDYKNITVPYNIAPLNFSYMGGEPCCLIIEDSLEKLQIKGIHGHFSIPDSKWGELMQRNVDGELKLTVVIKENNEWVGLEPFSIKVASTPIDNYVSYRLIPPGYEGWKEMGIYQRDLRTFEETAIYENKSTNHNCVNCHSFCMQNPDKMMFHVRADFNGTVLIQNQKIEKLDTKTESTTGPLVYPYWHPSGDYIAFSVNKTMQNFFNHHPNRIEVYDTESDVVVYDIKNHQITYSPLTKSSDAFETFPAFSPDGKCLYFCSAKAVDSLPHTYKEVKYSLCKIDFYPENATFGLQVDTVYNAQSLGKSVSFPRISPDGKYLAFTLHEYGNFSIWHKDADIWMYDMEKKNTYPLTEMNSDDVDSYHSWSSNSRWMIFSSRRTNGLYTRLFISYIDKNGVAHKPFLLPQENPLLYYKKLMFSYNTPEFMTSKVNLNKHFLIKNIRTNKIVSVKVKKVIP